MANHVKQAIYLLCGIILIVLLAFIGAWGFLLMSSKPATYAWAKSSPWPVACSNKGCLTTHDWARQITLAEKFAATTGVNKATPAEALTTLVRQDLVANSFLKSPITRADAKRYRQDVLKLTDGDFIQSTVGVSADDYDRYVILPFLQQEALLKTRNIKAVDELYAQVSKERTVVLLTKHFRWDASKGAVVEK